MDGVLLWNRLYRAVAAVDAGWTSPRVRRGHPDEYSEGQILLGWLWSALGNTPLAVAAKRLADPLYRRAQRCMGFLLPPGCPHETTLRRRSRRPEFWLFLLVVGRLLLTLLAPDTRTMLIDSTPLPVPHTSRDRDATWGHHATRGYRAHTITSADRVILVWSVHGANVQELTVAPTLVSQAAGWGWRPRYLSGDQGYDSEPLHAEVHRRLGARMVAPFNDRGGRRTMRRTPLRRALRQRWNSPAIQRVVRLRPEIDRMYSVLKSGRFGLFALPPWVRGQAGVERWISLKILLYHSDLLAHRRNHD